MENKPTDSQMDEYSIIKSLIKIIGDDPEREGLQDTPKRVIKSFQDLFCGYKKDAKEVLSKTFDADNYDQIVILKDIEMYSTCEHHMIPFVGKVSIAYLPSKRVVGLSKLARTVEIFSRRLQIQERLTKQIADAITECLQPKGTVVLIKSKHFCMCARGVNKQNSEMITSYVDGVFRDKPEAREEVFNLFSF